MSGARVSLAPALVQDIAACAFPLGFSLIAHRVLPARTRVPAGAAAVGAGVLIARRLGLSWRDLGLDPRAAPRGTLAGVAASMVVGTVTAAGLVVPRARRFYLEERIASASFGQMIHAVFVRIPFGTALPEELLFRGVVLGMLTRQRSSVRATIVSSLAFGLWHVLPALERIETNPGTSHHSGNSLRTAAVVAAHVATTTAAGVGFSWLRLRSGSVIAPAIAHAAPNGAGFLAGWALARLTRHRQRDQAPSETPSDRPVPGNDGPAIHPGERPLGVRSGHPSAVNS